MLLGFPQIFSAKAPHTEACCRVQLDRIGWQCLLSASEHPQAHWIDPLALDGGEEGMDIITHILALAPRLLKDSGYGWGVS